MLKKKFNFSSRFNLIEQAQENLNLAKQNFNYAFPEFFEIANLELTIAKMQLKVAYMKASLINKKDTYSKSSK